MGYILLIDDQADTTINLHFPRETRDRIIAVEQLSGLLDFFPRRKISRDEIECVFIDMFMPNQDDFYRALNINDADPEEAGINAIWSVLRDEGHEFMSLPIAIITGNTMNKKTEDDALRCKSQFQEIQIFRKIKGGDSSAIREHKKKRIANFLKSAKNQYNSKDYNSLSGYMIDIDSIDITLKSSEFTAINNSLRNIGPIKQEFACKYIKDMVIECLTQQYREAFSGENDRPPIIIGTLSSGKLLPSPRFSDSLNTIFGNEAGDTAGAIIRNITLQKLAAILDAYGTMSCRRWQAEVIEKKISLRQIREDNCA